MFSQGDLLLKQLEALKASNLADRDAEETAKRRKELDELLKPVPPFPEDERTPEAKQKRIDRAKDDFFYFDSVYFPKEMYPDYNDPGWFHKELMIFSEQHDKMAHIIAGGRGTAKTAFFKKKFVHAFLFGSRRYMLFGSDTLAPAANALLDMYYLLTTNERIIYDFDLQWHEGSSESLFARSSVNARGTYIGTLSAERSSRGKQRGFVLRPDYIFISDFENETVSLTRESVEKRIARLNEMRTSLADDGTLIWEGNNFDENCAMNYLFREEELGILSEQFMMHRYPAWSDKRPKNRRSIWPERYPATTEAEMKTFCKPKDDHDWVGNFQQEPKAKSGDIFPDANYHEWTELPKDIRGVIWTDPNCSLKDKGDTTAIGSVGFSAKMQKFYITSGRCKSYSDPNQLLHDLLTMKREERNRVTIISLGFDGNVAQESTWTNNVLNYSRLHNFPFPFIEYKKYKVDDLSTTVESEWKADKFLFPPGFRKTEEGKRFTDQIFSFRTKKAARKDDAPDALISAVELLQEHGIVSALGDGPSIVSVSKRTIRRRL